MNTAGMQSSLAPWALWLCAGLLLGGCSTQPQTIPTSSRVETTLLSHTLSIDAGEPRVLSTPQRNIRVTEQKLQQITEYDAQDQPVSSRESYQALPWANQNLTLIVEGQQFTLQTDNEGAVRLNLLDEQFIELDFEQLRVVEVIARASPNVIAEQDLLVSRELRNVLQEAIPLIYDNLEEGDAQQWVERVRRLHALGLGEESAQLENMLILLTVGDPELQFEFIQALERDHSGSP